MAKVRGQLRKQYGRKADIIHMPAGFSGNHKEHYVVWHDKGESYHHPVTGAKMSRSKVWKEPLKKSKSKRFSSLKRLTRKK